MLSGSVCCSCTATSGRAISGGAEGHGNPHHRMRVAHSSWGVIAVGTPWWVWMDAPFPEASALKASRNTGNLQKSVKLVLFHRPMEEKRKRRKTRKRNKEILLYSEMEFLWVTGKTLVPMSGHWTYCLSGNHQSIPFALNFLRQRNLQITSFVNHSFFSTTLLSVTFPIPPPSWGSVICAGKGARRGLLLLPCGRSIAGIPGDSCPWSLQKWQTAGEKSACTHTYKCYNFHN